MRIAFLVVKNIARGGGIEKYTCELGSRLVKKGHQVIVYSMKHYGNVVSEYEGMEIVPVPSFKGKTLEKGTTALFALFKSLRSKHDILHFHTIPAATWIGLAKLIKKKCVLQWHGLEWKRSRFSSLSSKIALMLEKKVMRLNVNHTAVSKTQCSYFKDIYGVDVKYIPAGADIKLKPEPKEILRVNLEPNNYILFASRLVREKGAHYLIPAFRKLKTDCRLVIAGDVPGEDDYKSELMALADNDPRIIFPGFVTGRLLDELFSHCLIYTQPSEIEGLSIALLEAMSYGCPCLVSNIPENLEAIGNVGWSFESKNVYSLHDKLDELINSKQKLAAAGGYGKERVQEHYSWDSIADKFEDFYKRVLDN